MEGITKEGESIIEDTEAGTATRDVGLILAPQKVEHYEIATYGGLSQLAKTLGYDKVDALMQTTLAEEKNVMKVYLHWQKILFLKLVQMACNFELTMANIVFKL